ncbi:MAG: MFS transporter [Bianqueaceae bacterium]
MFLILWSTQSLSSLGSAMTSFALVIWSYQQNGSALTTSLLSICSYAPYVAMSIFAGALSDRWNKKYTMLVSDTLAALSTLAVLFLLKSGQLRIGHLYLLNAVNGLMNTVQQPASAVSVSLLTPRKYYQRISALNSLSNSLITVLTPVIATALLTFSSIDTVILLDLATCIVAVSCLALLITIPETGKGQTSKAEPLFISAKKGLQYLHRNRGILDLILFLAAINLVASMYNAALPAMLLSRKNGGKAILGMVNTWARYPGGKRWYRWLHRPEAGSASYAMLFFFYEYREFGACPGKNAARLVYRRHPRLDFHTGHECQYGRPSAFLYSRRSPGPGLLCSKCAAIFYDSAGLFPRGLVGRHHT